MYQDFGTYLLKDGALAIPRDPKNLDYQAYLAWAAAGNVATPGQTLAEKQAAKLQQVSAWRDAAIAKGLSFKGVMVWSDKDSITDVMQALAALQAVAALPAAVQATLPAVPTTVSWKAWSGTQDNIVHVDLSQDDLRLLLAQLSINTETAYGIEAQLIAAVKAATDDKTLAGIVWPG